MKILVALYMKFICPAVAQPPYSTWNQPLARTVFGSGNLISSLWTRQYREEIPRSFHFQWRWTEKSRDSLMSQTPLTFRLFCPRTLAMEKSRNLFSVQSSEIRLPKAKITLHPAEYSMWKNVPVFFGHHPGKSVSLLTVSVYLLPWLFHTGQYGESLLFGKAIFKSVHRVPNISGEFQEIIQYT